MSDASRWPDALLVGVASSMRTLSGAAGLAAHGRISGKPRVAVLLAAAGELGVDKTPAATDRTDAPAVGGRMTAGALVGREIAGTPGLAAGAVGAFVGSFSTWRTRKLVVDATGLPDPVVAIGEDLVAYSVAALATRPDAEPEPEPPTGETTDEPVRPAVLRGIGIGLAAGLAGTAAMTIAQGAEFVLTDAKPSSAPADIADKIKRRAGLGKLKRKHKPAANQAMHWLFGTSWGVPLGLVATSTNVRPEILGPAHGVFVWTAALAHQPAMGIADVPWKRSLQSLGSEALFHVVYGIGAGAALRALSR